MLNFRLHELLYSIYDVVRGIIGEFYYYCEENEFPFSMSTNMELFEEVTVWLSVIIWGGMLGGAIYLICKVLQSVLEWVVSK